MHRASKFPLAHRRAIPTTNLRERLLGETRRRTKVIPHAFAERAVLKPMYAAPIRAAAKDELDRDFGARTTPAASAKITALPARLSSKNTDLPYGLDLSKKQKLN